MNEKEQGIGLLGCGAIGRGLARAVDEKAVGGARLVALFDQDSRNARDLSQRLGSSPKAVDSFQDFLDSDGVTMVVEAASQEAVRLYGETIVSAGKHLMVMSTGSLLDASLFSRLSSLAQETGCRIFAPSGALGGIDAIRASRAELEEVVLTTRKPPESLVDTAAAGAGGYKDIVSRHGRLRGERAGGRATLSLQHQRGRNPQPGRYRPGADQGEDHRRSGGQRQHPRGLRRRQQRGLALHHGERAPSGQPHDKPPCGALRHRDASQYLRRGSKGRGLRATPPAETSGERRAHAQGAAPGLPATLTAHRRNVIFCGIRCRQSFRVVTASA